MLPSLNHHLSCVVLEYSLQKELLKKCKSINITLTITFTHAHVMLNSGHYDKDAN